MTGVWVAHGGGQDAFKFSIAVFEPEAKTWTTGVTALPLRTPFDRPVRQGSGW